MEGAELRPRTGRRDRRRHFIGVLDPSAERPTLLEYAMPRNRKNGHGRFLWSFFAWFSDHWKTGNRFQNHLTWNLF